MLIFIPSVSHQDNSYAPWGHMMLTGGWLPRLRAPAITMSFLFT